MKRRLRGLVPHTLDWGPAVALVAAAVINLQSEQYYTAAWVAACAGFVIGTNLSGKVWRRRLKEACDGAAQMAYQRGYVTGHRAAQMNIPYVGDRKS